MYYSVPKFKIWLNHRKAIAEQNVHVPNYWLQLWTNFTVKSTEVLNNRDILEISFNKFDYTTEDFDTYSYIERLSAFLNIQNVPETKRVETLISVLSPNMYSC